MEEMINKDILQLMAQLQKKKAKVRQAITEMGTLKREGKNAYDGYTYFSEAQYKALFNPLFTREGLELRVSEEAHETYDGPGKQTEGRLVTLQIDLIDVDTGFAERSFITGDGVDKGDKGIYKAYTGAIKYYLSTTFMVPTGDDAEKPSNYCETKTEQKETVSQSPETDNAKNEPIDHIKKVRRKREHKESPEVAERNLLDELPFD